MVAPRYERLNTYESSNNTNDDIEIETNRMPQNGKSTKELHASQPNFSYVNKPTSGSATSSANTEIETAAAAMPRQEYGQFMQMAIGTLVIVLVYLSLSISLTFYQKNIIKKFKFPLTIVTYHLVIKLMLASFVRTIYSLRDGKSRVQLDWRTMLRKMAPTGVASGIDIGFSNWGLELVPISLYTMTKSSTIVFILLFAILLGLEKKSWFLVFIVGLIATGLFMFTYKSTQFNALGFFFILFASLSSGVRWSLAQFIMQKSKLGLQNPVDMIYHMQPWMILSLVPFLIIFEGEQLYNVLMGLDSVPGDVIIWIIAKVTFGAWLAFLMEIGEFLVLMRTSSLTLSIAGIFKDICQLGLAVQLNDDQMSTINVLGLVVCLLGISAHVLHKYRHMNKALKQLNADDENNVSDEYEFNKSTTIISGGGKNSILTVPLLEQTDSEDDLGNNVAGNKQNESDIIFDVLKRRDMQR